MTFECVKCIWKTAGSYLAQYRRTFIFRTTTETKMMWLMAFSDNRPITLLIRLNCTYSKGDIQENCHFISVLKNDILWLLNHLTTLDSINNSAELYTYIFFHLESMKSFSWRKTHSYHFCSYYLLFQFLRKLYLWYLRHSLTKHWYFHGIKRNIILHRFLE